MLLGNSFKYNVCQKILSSPSAITYVRQAILPTAASTRLGPIFNELREIKKIIQNALRNTWQVEKIRGGARFQSR